MVAALAEAAQYGAGTFGYPVAFGEAAEAAVVLGKAATSVGRGHGFELVALDDAVGLAIERTLLLLGAGKEGKLVSVVGNLVGEGRRKLVEGTLLRGAEVGELNVGLSALGKPLAGPVMRLCVFGEYLEPCCHSNGGWGKARRVVVVPSEELLAQTPVEFVVEGLKELV